VFRIRKQNLEPSISYLSTRKTLEMMNIGQVLMKIVLTWFEYSNALAVIERQRPK